MKYKKRLYLLGCILTLLAVAGCRSAEKPAEKSVNGFYVNEFVGETGEEAVIPEDVSEDVPDDIALQKNELYIGADQNANTASEQNKILESLQKAGKASASEVKQEEKALKIKKSAHYYYYTLNSDQKAVYRTILKGLSNREDGFTVYVSRANLYDAYCRVMYDHPELFWAELNYRYWDYGSYVFIRPQYNRTKEQIATDKKAVNKAIRKIKKACRKKSKYDKVLYVYKHLIDTIDYKLDARDNQNVYSSLVSKKTVCAGYAKATQLLLQKMGIQCLYVLGNTNRGYHAWNIVKLGDQYYQMDTCWGDLDYSNSSADYLRNLPKALRYDYRYYCIDDSNMFKTRSQDNHLGLPACRDMNKSFYIYNKRYFTSYGDQVKNSIKNNIRNGKHYWQGQMANREAYLSLLNAVKNGLYPQYLYDIKGKSVYAYYVYYDDQNIIQLYY